MNSAVVLIDPKYPHNVGGALRACSAFGIDGFGWTGNRVEQPEKWPKGARLPREERMKLYRDVDLHRLGRMKDDANATGSVTDHARSFDLIPVCVEVSDNAEQLPDFVHPPCAMYIFGPEDGNVPKGIRVGCWRFVTIPSKSCLNLAAAVNVVLYDRLVKARGAAEAAPQERLAAARS